MPFLSGSQQMTAVVLIEVNAVDGAPHLLILQDALGAIAERNDHHAVAADRRLSGDIVHLGVTHLRRHIAVHPRIEDAGAIDAKQHAEALLLFCVVDMREDVDAALRIVGRLAQHTVNHTRRARGGGDFTRIEYVERQCIIGLVTSAIADGRTCLQSHLLGRSRWIR